MTAPATLFVFFIFLSVISNSKAQILQHPQNITVLANQPAEFKCVVRGPNAFVGLNRTYIRDLPDDVQSDLNLTTTQMNDTTTEFQLIIRAKPRYNGTVIECSREFLDRLPILSDAAVLLIQGVPSPVGNLTASYNTNGVSLFWTAPFSLDMTGVDPDIWYSVIIYNVTDDENNPQTVPCTNCIFKTNETHYTFTNEHHSPNHVYVFSVAAINGAGQSISINITVCVPTFTVISVEAVCNGVDVTFDVQGEKDYYTHYILRGVADEDNIKNQSAISSDHQVTYTLPADRIYSVFFEVFTTVGSINTSYFTLSTYDLQAILLVEKEDDLVRVRGEFAVNSGAAGCLVIFQGPFSSSPDVFRTLVRTEGGSTASSSVSLSPGTYTVYGYDLEKNWVPKASPAVVQKHEVLTNPGNTSRNISKILKRGNISQSEMTVVIDCEFEEGYPQASCVLVYRQYDSPLLSVLEFSRLINFPVSLTMDNPQNYTFALFGKNSVHGIEGDPVIIATFRDTKNGGKEIENGRGEEMGVPQAIIILISLGTFVTCLAVGVSLLLVLVFVRQCCKCRQQTEQETRNGMFYEEIDLQKSPPNIAMETNAAYTTHASNITITDNAAYDTHIIRS